MKYLWFKSHVGIQRVKSEVAHVQAIKAYMEIKYVTTIILNFYS